jgi:hypothetical protein
MIEFKSMLQSRTVWANLIGLLALILSLLGFRPSVVDKEQLIDAILQIIAAVSFLASTAFRITATKKIGL